MPHSPSPWSYTKNYFAVTRFLLWPHTSDPSTRQPVSPPYFHLHPQPSRSHPVIFFPYTLPLFRFIFGTGNAPVTTAQILYHESAKPLFVALPTPLPALSFYRVTTPRKRGILHQEIILDLPSLTTPLNNEIFDAPPSQMIPCILSPADSFDSLYNISGFATVSVRPRQDRARGKIDRGNCVRDRIKKKSTCTVTLL